MIQRVEEAEDRSELERESRPWDVAVHDASVARGMERDLRCSGILASLLAIRGFDSGEGARGFLESSLRDLTPPESLPDIDVATEMIERAIRERASICIYGDYDVDGITSTALLVRVFRYLGVPVETYVPDRLRDGYGVREEAVARIADRGASLLITVDGGANDLAALRLARERGMEVIVTDHHPIREFTGEFPIVHPAREDSPSPFPEFSGVGVAYKLVWALGKRLAGGERVADGYRRLMIDLLALVALGTVADVVPLRGENRSLVRQGLRSIVRSPLPGLHALMDVCKLNDVVTAEDVAFRLAPHLNAAGRLGRAEDALELLLCDDTDRALELAQTLQKANRKRKEIEKTMLEACEVQVDEHGFLDRPGPLVLADQGWHSGVAGIVAARLVDRYQRPVFVIALEGDHGRGSARTVPSVPLDRFYEAGRSEVRSVGGHSMAGGIHIQSTQVESFRAALATVETAPAAEQARISVDLRLPLSAVEVGVLRDLEHLAPFGSENPVPRFLIEGLELAAPVRLVGRAEEHLSFVVREGNRRTRAIFFRGASWARHLSTTRRPFSVVCELTEDQRSGRPELRVVDIGL